MAFSHVLTLGWSQGNLSISKQITKSSDAENNRDITVPQNSTNLAITFALDVSELKALYIVSTVNLTLETNSGSSPTDTLTLVAGEPVIWWTGCPVAIPFSADVTGLFATTGAVGEGLLSIRALYDATP